MTNPGDQLSSSINALTNEYNTIAHNIANVNTSGFKRHVSMFSQELMKRVADTGDDQVPVGEIKSTGAIDFSQGSLARTGRPLDAALNGKGFFVIETADGPLYTRNGVFHVNGDGRLVDLLGRTVAGKDAPINVPAGVSELSIKIAEDGGVNADGVALGKLKMVEFADEEKLIAAGESCFFAPKDVKPIAAKDSMVTQGYQEKSNVKLMTELVDLISISKLYETNMNILRRRRENSKAMLGVANG